MKFNRIFFQVVLISWPLLNFGQQVFKSKADELRSLNHFPEASRLYLGLHESGDRQALLDAAMTLYQARRLDEALLFFIKADSLSILDDKEEVFAYFECLKWMKRYDDADQLLRSSRGGKITGKELYLNSEKLPLYQKLLNFRSAEISPLAFNTPFSEISPTLYKDWLYFVSTVPGRAYTESAQINNQPYYNLYAVPVSSDLNGFVKPVGSFGQPERAIRYGGAEAVSLPNGLNKKYHDGPIYAVPSGNMVFFNTNWSAEKRPKVKGQEVNLLLYYIIKTGDTWSQPVSVPFNSFSYSNQHPYFDEATSTLYFSSNMSGGHGSFDLWKSTYTGGVWSKPENLGDKVNSPRDEVFPTIAPDGSLIFSSNGWPGLGGLDLFIMTDPKWPPVNMTSALNSERDDFGLCFRNEGLAYMTSNRPGGKGDDDIYLVKFDLKELKSFMRPSDRSIAGMIKDQATGQALDNVRITLSGAVSKELSATNGKFESKFNFDEVKFSIPEVIIRYERDGYQSKETKVAVWKADQELINISESLTAVKEIADSNPRVVESVKLKTQTKPESLQDQLNRPNSDEKNDLKEKSKFIVYFDFDKYNIRKDAAEVLAKVVYVLLQDLETSEVYLTGHTDSRGPDSYNEQLSKQRVEFVKKWLVEKGVSPNRIRTEARGERQVAVWCKGVLSREVDPDACLSASEHQLNRRVEIEIVNVQD